jgi:hypothetical protein
MAGPAAQRAVRVVSEMRRLRAEALVVCRIPGASHCAHEGARLAEVVARELGAPCLDVEIPTLSDSFSASIQTRLEALAETARALRGPSRSKR